MWVLLLSYVILIQIHEFRNTNYYDSVCTLLVHKANKVNFSLIISGVLSKKNFSELEENIK